MSQLPALINSGQYAEHEPVKPKGPRDKNLGPLKAKDVRAHVMEAAGVTREELGALLRKAIDTTLKQMDATVAQTFAYQGKVGDTIYRDDNATQLKAAELAIKFVDQMPRGTQDKGPKVPSVVINLPNIYSKDTLDNKIIIETTPDPLEETEDED